MLERHLLTNTRTKKGSQRQTAAFVTSCVADTRSRFSTDCWVWGPMAWECESLTESPPTTMHFKWPLELRRATQVTLDQVLNTITEKLASILARERDTL